MSDQQTRRHIELVWEEFWRAGIYDPVTILEQLLYLLFLKQLDPDPAGASPPCPTTRGQQSHDREYMRWRAFRRLGEIEQFAFLNEQVFPRLRCIGGPGGAYACHMKDAFLAIPAAALCNIIRCLDRLPPEAPGEREPFDYVADKLASIRRAGVPLTPRPIEALMVALVAPVPNDIICNPLSGSGSLLIAAAQYLTQHYPGEPADLADFGHRHQRTYHAFDADKLMLRVACMKLLLHGIQNPDIRYSDAIAPDVDGDQGRYSVILAHPPALCLPGNASQAKAIASTVLHLSRMLKPGGRAAVIVPESLVHGRSGAERAVRRNLLHKQPIDAAIRLPLTRVATPEILLLFTAPLAPRGMPPLRSGSAVQPFVPVRSRWSARRATPDTSSNVRAGDLISGGGRCSQFH